MSDRQPTPLGVAATRKRADALDRAHAALRQLDAQGATISFQGVARHARVSRQWLYQQPELRGEIERLRQQPDASSRRVPSAQRASEASLRQHVHALRAENRDLREHNAALKTELALAYGQHRDQGS